MSTTTLTTYTIQQGETLSSIAQKYGISATELRQFHNQNAPIDDLMGSPDDFTNNGKLSYALIPPQEETYVATLGDETEPELSTEEQNSEEEQQTEQSSGQATEHDKKYVVIQKGLCVCDQSIPPNQVPVQFKVDSHKLQHANGDTSEHLIVTEEDVFFQKSSQPFGPQCKLQPNSSSYNPCSYTPAGKWQKTYEKIKVMDKKILTELSELQCSFGGKITVFRHGQTQEVTTAHFENVEKEELWAISPLAAKPELETPKVKSIKAKTAESKAENSSSTKSKPIGKNEKLDKRADGVAELTVKLGEQVQFEVKDWYNPTKANKNLTSWEVLHSGNESPDWNDTVLMKYEEFGSILQRDFDTLGNFRVYAYGNEETKRDNRCAIDVNVVINELKGIKAAGDNVSGGLIRKGFPVNFQPDFKFTPSQEELQRVEMGVKDNAGNIVDSQFSSETGLVFTPENAIKYNVWIRYTNDLGEIKSDSKTFEAKPNVVDAIQASPAQAVYRPGSTITFTVSKMRFSPLDDDPDYSKIKWKVGNATSPTTGKTLTHTFHEEETKVVEAFMNTADGTGADSYKVVVSRNKVKTIKGGNTVNWIVGKWYTVEVETLMPFDPDKGDKLTWKSELPGHFEIKEAIGNKVQIRAIKTILAPLPGITANMGDSVAMLMVGANLAEIKRWCFTDAKDYYKEKAGWGEEIKVLLESSSLMAGEKVHLHLLEHNNYSSDSYIQDLGEVEFNESGIAQTSFKTDEIKQKLLKLGTVGEWNSKEGDFYDLKFVIEKKEGSIQFANTEEKERGGKESYYPNKTSTVSNGEIGKFLFIDNEKDIVDVRFLDGNGNRLWKILEYGQPAKVYIQTRNMAGTKIKRQIFLNKAKGDDIEIDKEKEYTVPDNELLEIDINTNFFKKYVPEKERKTVSMFYYVLKESDGDVFKYPKDLQISQKLDISKPNFYHHLKLMESPQLMNALAATNAPLIVGEPLVPDSTNKENKVCECEARVRAFLRMIRIGEGTQDEGGYTRIVGGSSFSEHGKDMSDHPKVYIAKHDSTAAGAYQITKTNWNDAAFKKWRDSNKITDFSKVSQDIYGVYLVIKKKGAFNEIKNKDLRGAVKKCEKEWASLPGAGYGQREEKFETIQKKYDEFLTEELAEKTTLHIKKGFLKDIFNITCCTSNNTSGATKPGYDIDKAVAYVISNAKTQKPYGDCALYIRKAINAGGISGSWGDAWQYITALPTIGFTDLGKITDFNKGDIVVFNKTGGRKWGHIAMWTGSQWVSDFKQNSIIVHSDYEGKDYHVFRWQ